MTLIMRQIGGKYNVEVSAVYAFDEIPQGIKDVLSRKSVVKEIEKRIKELGASEAVAGWGIDLLDSFETFSVYAMFPVDPNMTIRKADLLKEEKRIKILEVLNDVAGI